MRRLGLFAAAVLLTAACAPRKPVKPFVVGRPAQTATVNLEAQKRIYEEGVAHFGEDRYAEAKKSWTQAVKMGPQTALGRKAQANLQKVDSMLRRLQELEKQ